MTYASRLALLLREGEADWFWKRLAPAVTDGGQRIANLMGAAANSATRSTARGWHRIGAPCRIRIYGVEGRIFGGEIIQLKPLVARINDGDRIWHNCQVAPHQARIRRAS